MERGRTGRRKVRVGAYVWGLQQVQETMICLSRGSFVGGRKGRLWGGGVAQLAQEH
jgi:hypothetical protein